MLPAEFSYRLKNVVRQQLGDLSRKIDADVQPIKGQFKPMEHNEHNF